MPRSRGMCRPCDIVSAEIDNLPARVLLLASALRSLAMTVSSKQLLGLYWGNGKENGNYRDYRGYNGIYIYTYVPNLLPREVTWHVHTFSLPGLT